MRLRKLLFKTTEPFSKGAKKRKIKFLQSEIYRNIDVWAAFHKWRYEMVLLATAFTMFYLWEI